MSLIENCPDCIEKLLLNSVSMNDHAWQFTNLEVLKGGADVGGNDKQVPHGAGVILLPRKKIITRRTLEGQMTGEVWKDGTVATNRRAALDDSIAYLVENVVEPGLLTAGITAELVLADGSSLEGIVKVESPLQLGRNVGDFGYLATLDISLPYGQLLPAP